MKSMFVKAKDEPFGSYSMSELKKLVAAGKFSAQDMVYRESEDEWIEAEKVKELDNLFAEPTEQEHQRKVFAIGGGKGGVGKTILTASLGIGLATMGQDVVMVDADLGGANLHTFMGILEPKYTYYHFLTRQRNRLNDVIIDTPIENLKLISGACGVLGLPNLRYTQKLRFINQLKNIDAEYILLDLGAGASYNVLDFFLAADEHIIVTTPEPMAIQDSFNFLKVCLLRKLLRTFHHKSDILDVLDKNGNSKSESVHESIEDLHSQVCKMDHQAGQTFEEILTEFRPKLILNMVYKADEIKQGTSFQVAAAEQLSLNVEYLGYMEFDEHIHYAVKDLKPFMIDNPHSKASKSLAKIITLKMLGNSGWQGFREKRRFYKQISNTSYSYPASEIQESKTICSVRCLYWDDCEYQNGGFPCGLRRLEPIFNI